MALSALSLSSIRQKCTSLVHALRHPKPYILSSLLTALLAILFGLDTGSIGPITTMPQLTSTIGPLSPTLHGLLVSSILIPAATSSFFTGHVADALGRPRSMCLGAAVFGIGSALEAAALNLGMLFAGRLVTGTGEGLFLSTIIVYICEISPPRERGALASMQQLAISFGIMVGFFTCYGTVGMSSSLAWRVPFALQSAVAFALSVAMGLMLPQSPRWLAMVGRQDEAERVWERLGVSRTEREKAEELQAQQAQQENNREAEASDGAGAGRKKRDFLRIFRRAYVKQTMLGVFLMSFQQLSGIDGVLYYAPLLFQQAGLSSSEASFLASGISSLVMFIVTIPATLFSDRWGRRASTIFGGLAIALSMLLIGSLYAAKAVHGDHGVARWLVIAALYMFMIAFSVSWAVGIKIYTSEIQPAETRATATSLCYTSNWVVNFLVALTTPISLANSTFGAYFYFGSATLFAVAICSVFMPETRLRSLESINESFRAGQSTLRLRKLGRWVTKNQGRGSARSSHFELAELPATSSENQDIDTTRQSLSRFQESAEAEKLSESIAHVPAMGLVVAT